MWVTRAKKAAALVLLVFLLSQAGCSGSKDKNASLAGAELITDKSTTYRTTEAAISDLMRQVSATLEPVYVHRSTVTSGSETLVLESIEVSRGDFVKRGDVIAVLSGTGSRSDVRQLSLELDYAMKAYEENCAIMEDSIQRTSLMPAEDIYDEQIRELSIEKQQAAYELYRLNTERSLALLREQIEKGEASLGKQYIYAQFDGIVRSVENIATGIELDPGTPLMTISRADSLMLFSSTAADLYKYNKEVVISVRVGEDIKTTTGRVVSSSKMVPGYFGTFVYIAPDDPSVIGQAAEAKATCEYVLLEDAVIIPRSGVETEKGRSYVTILDGDTVRKRYIVAGPQLASEIAVFQGVEPGDMIVTSQFTS